MKKVFQAIALAGALSAAFAGSAQAATEATDQALKAAISGAQRTPANAARDGARHPYETLSFFGIKPTSTVVELSPGGGWYTEILAPYLRDQGKLIEGANDPNAASEYSRRSIDRLKQKLAANPSVYDKVQLGIFEPPSKQDYAAKGSVDLVVTFRNIHNWVDDGGDANVKSVFQTAYDSLKKGGVFGVVEHRLPAGKAQDAKASSGYVHEAYVIKLAESVGFKLQAKSEINANPKDNADHENGVWALPPTYANKEKNRDAYQAIGESDRMTLKFVKP
ncbi:class I SAM-dependent methyltransferase [Undibacterium terreum]|uniref:Methyltransferase n=1 Tax=Undibacterium terreum TaxID=1224302 RepID=A0A916UH16_9BURK|nr:class I SAM-dependent methyltransferase [Undibacterium terreum]GGC72616.1 methyltransferase [Undibacterium terreum]